MRELGLFARDFIFLLTAALIGNLLGRYNAGVQVESWFNRMARHRTTAILICAAAAMIPRLAALPWVPPPEPDVQDEFSYLFGAQTLLAGRLTNPTPALWQHFETFHINMVPSYQSMYPPAPFAFYSLGIWLGKNAWWGVWLATGLVSAAVCWALQPILRPRWALLAGLVFAVKYGMITRYSETLFGGTVPALGGALALGAFVRLRSGGQQKNAVLLMFGIALLANSRPYEGLLFAIPIAVATLTWILKNRRYTALALTAALVAILLAGMAFYNLRGTGNALKMPYMVNYEQYHFVRPFLGFGMRAAPHYRHYEMALDYDYWEGVPGRQAQTLAGIMSLLRERFRFYYSHLFPLQLLIFVGVAVAFASPQRRLLAYTFLLVACGAIIVVWRPSITYAGPIVVSYCGLGVLGLRWVRVSPYLGRRARLFWPRGVVVLLLLASLGNLYEGMRKGLRPAFTFPLQWNLERTRILHDLEKLGGEHLVLIKYLPQHVFYQEWVYNSPEIDKQKVILARAMSAEEDCALIRHYPGRQTWILEPDRFPTLLIPLETWPIGPKCGWQR